MRGLSRPGCQAYGGRDYTWHNDLVQEYERQGCFANVPRLSRGQGKPQQLSTRRALAKRRRLHRLSQPARYAPAQYADRLADLHRRDVAAERECCHGQAFENKRAPAVPELPYRNQVAVCKTVSS